jgi:hypothetical protein
MAFFKDLFNTKDNSLVGLRRLNDVQPEQKPVKVQKVKREMKLSELMKKSAVE